MPEGVDSETRGIPPLRPEKDKWTSLQTRMIKTGGRLVRHARRLVFQLAEVLVSREILTGIWSIVKISTMFIGLHASLQDGRPTNKLVPKSSTIWAVNGAS